MVWVFLRIYLAWVYNEIVINAGKILTIISIFLGSFKNFTFHNIWGNRYRVLMIPLAARRDVVGRKEKTSVFTAAEQSYPNMPYC